MVRLPTVEVLPVNVGGRGVSFLPGTFFVLILNTRLPDTAVTLRYLFHKVTW